MSVLLHFFLSLLLLAPACVGTLSGQWITDVVPKDTISAQPQGCVVVPTKTSVYCITTVGEDIFEFDYVTSSWKVVSHSVSKYSTEYPALHSFASTYDPHRHAIVIHGGMFLRHGVNVTVGHTFSYYLDEGEWIKEEVHGPEAHSHCLVAHDNSLFVFTGSMMYSLSPESADWEQQEVSGLIGSHASFICAKYADSLYLFGGVYNSKRTSKLFSIHLSTLKMDVVTVSGDIPSPREAPRSIFAPSFPSLGFDHPLWIIFGGYSENQRFSTDVFLFNFEKQAWVQIINSEPIPEVPAIYVAKLSSILFLEFGKPKIDSLSIHKFAVGEEKGTSEELVQHARNSFEHINETLHAHASRAYIGGKERSGIYTYNQDAYNFVWTNGQAAGFSMTGWCSGGRGFCYRNEPAKPVTDIRIGSDHILYEINYKSNSYNWGNGCSKLGGAPYSEDQTWGGEMMIKVKCNPMASRGFAYTMGVRFPEFGPRCGGIEIEAKDPAICQVGVSYLCLSNDQCVNGGLCKRTNDDWNRPVDMCFCTNDADCGNGKICMISNPGPAYDWDGRAGGCNYAQTYTSGCTSNRECASNKCVNASLGGQERRPGVRANPQCGPAYPEQCNLFPPNTSTPVYDAATFRCVAGPGMYCVEHSDCLTDTMCVRMPGNVNKSCACSNDAHCKPGQNCVDGVCLLPAHSPCEDNYYCKSDKCITEYHANSTTCGCMLNSECATNECKNNLCLLDIGAQCNETSWCAASKPCIPYPDETTGCGCGYPVTLTPAIAYDSCTGSTAVVNISQGVMLPAVFTITDSQGTTIANADLVFAAVVGETYTVAITDDNGCTGTVTIFIPPVTAPQVLTAPVLTLEDRSLASLPNLKFEWNTNLTLAQQGYKKVENFTVSYRHYCSGANITDLPWSSVSFPANQSQFILPAQFGNIYEAIIAATNCFGTSAASTLVSSTTVDPYQPSLKTSAPELIQVPTQGGLLSVAGTNLRLPLNVVISGGFCYSERMNETLIVCNITAGWQTSTLNTINVATNYVNASDPDKACTQLPASAVWRFAPPTITDVPLISPRGGTYTIIGTNFGPISAPVIVTHGPTELNCTVQEAHVSLACTFPAGSGTKSLKIAVGSQDVSKSHAYAECGISCSAIPFTMAPPTVQFDVTYGSMLVTWFTLMHPSETGGIALDRYFLEYRTNCSVPSGWTVLDFAPDVDMVSLPYQHSTKYEFRVRTNGCCYSEYSEVTKITSPDNPLLPILMASPAPTVPTGGGSLILQGANIPTHLDNISVVLFSSSKGSFSCASLSIREVLGGSGVVDCVVPKGSGGGNYVWIGLTAPSCITQTSNNLTWSYASPNITAMSQLNTNGGSVTITGSSFGESTAVVLVDDQPCSNCQATSDTSVACAQCPGGYDDNHHLQVVVNGQPSNLFAFSYPICTPVCVYGICAKNTTGTHCQCDAGYAGIDCSQEVVCAAPATSRCGACGSGLCCHFVGSPVY